MLLSLYDFDGVGATLLLHDQQDGVVAVESADGAGFFIAVGDRADVVLLTGRMRPLNAAMPPTASG